MNITNSYEEAISFYRDELLRFKDEMLSQKAIACIKLTDYVAKIALESIHYLIRIKRGFRFLGTIINELADIPTGDMWDDQQEMNADILKITEDEAKEIKDLKKKLKVEHTAIKSLEKLLLNISSNEIIERTEIAALEKLFDDDTIVDTYCFKALKIAEKLSFEKEIAYDISHHSKQFLPSRYMFPIDKITPVINEHAKKDRLTAPIFFTENEIYDMMTLQSTVTVYDEKNKKLRSVLKIPLADFSENMETFELPNLDQKDMYRLHRLELLGVKKVNRYLCSKRMKTIRLLSIEDLQSCQKHKANYENTFICQKRKVMMKHIFDDCSKVTKLPPALIFEVDNEHFLVDHPPQTVKITCISNNITSRENMTLAAGPIKIKVPQNCELTSEYIEIARSVKETDSILLGEKVKIYKIENRHTSLHDDAVENSKYSFERSSPKLSESFDFEDEKTDDDILEAKKKFKKLTSHDHYGFDYAALSIAVFSAVSVLIYLLVKICRKMPPKRDIEMQVMNDPEKLSKMVTELNQYKIEAMLDSSRKEEKIIELENELKDFRKKFKELNDRILRDLVTITKSQVEKTIQQ